MIQSKIKLLEEHPKPLAFYNNLFNKLWFGLLSLWNIFMAISSDLLQTD